MEWLADNWPPVVFFGTAGIALIGGLWLWINPKSEFAEFLLWIAGFICVIAVIGLFAMVVLIYLFSIALTIAFAMLLIALFTK